MLRTHIKTSLGQLYNHRRTIATLMVAVAVISEPSLAQIIPENSVTLQDIEANANEAAGSLGMIITLFAWIMGFVALVYFAFTLWAMKNPQQSQQQNSGRKLLFSVVAMIAFWYGPQVAGIGTNAVFGDNASSIQDLDSSAFTTN